MAKTVRLENDEEHIFPDDATEEEINSLLPKFNQSNDSSISKIANNPATNAVLGAGDALRNQLGNAMHLIPGVNVGKVKSGEGDAYDYGHLAGEIAPSLALPEANLGRIGKAINYIPRAGKYFSEALGRILPQVGYSAATSENPLESGKETAKWQGIGEVPIAGAHVISKIAEKINPLKYTKELMGNIRTQSKLAEDKASEYYNSVLNKYGKDKITKDPDNFFGFDKEMEEYFGPDIKTRYKLFKKDPNLENAHKLQSQLFNDSVGLSGVPGEKYTYQALTNARRLVKDKINYHLSKDEEALQSYFKGGEITKNVVSPFKSTQTLRHITDEKKLFPDLSPVQLKKSLMNVSKKSDKSILENHYLSKALGDLNKKINVGEAYKLGGSALAGLALGEAFHPGLFGLGGAGAGLALGHILGTPAIKLAQNPNFNIKPLYQGLRNSIIASQRND